MNIKTCLLAAVLSGSLFAEAKLLYSPDLLTPTTLPGVQALGEMPLEKRNAIFQVYQEAGETVFWLASRKDPFEHTEHQIAYLPFASSGHTLVPAANVIADKTLRRIFIRLDHIRVYDYPGRGLHRILFTFEANNTLVGAQGVAEKVSFSQLYDAQEGEGTGVFGYPIFNGLNVGPAGVAFKGATLNVENKGDKAALDFMKSGVFADGLNLLTTAQPAIMPFAGILQGVSEMVLKRNENVKVQDFYLGLDFNDGAAFGARLAEGNYIVVQAPSDTFRWSDWTFDPVNRLIVGAQDPKKIMPFNYVCFRVSRFVD